MQESHTNLDTTLLNVAILPPKSTSAEVERLSGRLGQLGGMFQVDGKQRFAHLTVYMARFANSDIESIVDRTASLVTSRGPIALEHVGYHITPGNYYEVSYARKFAVMSLHDDVVNALLDMRFSPGNPVVEEYFGLYSPQQKKYAEVTGYDLARELYRPHVTITRFARRPEPGLPTATKELSFTATTIGLFKADSQGAVTDTLATWSL